MRPTIKYVHPLESNLAWTGRGRMPRWVSEYCDHCPGGNVAGLEELARAAQGLPVARFANSLTKAIVRGAALPEKSVTVTENNELGDLGEVQAQSPANAVTVTPNRGNDQGELPGLPPVPKKRGRPATGQAMSAAERKRKSREAARRRQVSGVDTLTDAQLIEAIGRELAETKRQQGEERVICKFILGRLLAELQARADKL